MGTYCSRRAAISEGVLAVVIMPSCRASSTDLTKYAPSIFQAWRLTESGNSCDGTVKNGA
jgi:hypothetical protein